MGMGADRNVRDHGWTDLLPVRLRWGPRKLLLGGQPPLPLTGVSRCQKPNFSPSVSDVCHLASVLCFLVARGSICPTFHHESHLEAFVKKPKILDPAESNSQGRLWLLGGNQSAVCVCVCVPCRQRGGRRALACVYLVLLSVAGAAGRQRKCPK